jgi:hypothetical protein
VLGAGGVAEEVPVGDITWQVAGNRQAVADTRAALEGSDPAARPAGAVR